MLGFGNGFVNWAEQHVPSGLAAVTLATSPFWMSGVEALRKDGERLSRGALWGLILGFSGILVLVWPDLHLGNAAGLQFTLGVIALQAACLGWAIGSSYSKRHPHGSSVIAATAVQMLFGGLMMLLAGTLVGEWPRVHLEGRGLWALVYLLFVGSIGGFVLVRLRAAASAGGHRLSLRVCQSADRCGVGGARPGRTVHRTHGRRHVDRLCRHGPGAHAETGGPYRHRRHGVPCVRHSSTMSRLPSVSALTANSVGWGFFLCTDKSVRTGRGGDYLALTLADATGQIVARAFDNVDRLREEFEVGEFVKAQGRANQFNGRLQFLIENIRRVMAGPDSQDRRDGFREDALVPSAPRPIDEMWDELQQVVSAVGNPHLKTLLARIVADHEAALRLWPAARVVHHAYRGGFLEHILTMAEAGRMLAVLYGANADLVVTGAILHDIGKLQELEYDTATTYTRDGNMIGHITLGAIMVHDACRAISRLPRRVAFAGPASYRVPSRGTRVGLSG